MAGQLWGTASTGGYLYSDELSETMRMELMATCKFRQLCDAPDFESKGEKAGDAVHWNVFSKIANNGTTLSENSEMPTSNFTIKQGTATVDEWGNSVPFTARVDLLGKQEVTDVVKRVLARDARETLDRAAHAQFDLTRLRYVATSTATGTLYANGTTTGTNTSALNKTHIRTLVDTAKERNIPPYRRDDYAMIARPLTFRPLRNELESVNQYVDQGYAKITAGEIGRFEGVRFIEQTNVDKGVSNSGTAWTGGLSDWAYFFGSDTVAEIIVVPPEIRAKLPTDYGRSHGIAWYALEGFGLIHNSTTDPDGTNSRIIKWDSLA